MLDLDEVMNTFSTSMVNPETPNYIIHPIKRPDGEIIWIRSSWADCQPQDNTELNFSMQVDMTDQIRLQQELEAKTVALEAALAEANQVTKFKSQFIAIVCHETRTPLNGILGMISLLEDTKLDSEQKDMLEVANGCGKALLDLVNEVLEFSKIEAGVTDLCQQDINLDELILSIRHIFMFAIQQKGLELIVSKAKNVPNVIKSDPVKLKRVLINLIGNAVKFTSMGHVKLRIDVSEQNVAKPSDIVLKFEVTDTGIGIRNEDIPHLFKPFTQVDTSSSRPFGGSGLGLAISKTLVELMGGQIEVHSQYGQGSTFTFTTAASSVDIAPLSTPVQQPLDTSSSEFGDLNVLVVEDNLVNQKLAVKMIQKLKVNNIDVASDGFKGVDAVQRKQYDVVFMDMAMPGMTGCEATEAIRKISDIRQPYISAMTANALDTDREQCMGSGMDDFISKPFKATDFIRVLARYKSISEEHA
jgi:signal transduction histidine kinase